MILSGRERKKKSHFYYSGFSKIHWCVHCLQVLDFWPLQEYFGLSESTFVPCDNKRHLEMKEHRRREYGRRGGRKEEDERRRVGERKGVRHYIDWWDSLVCNPRIHNACISLMASLCVLTLRDHLSHSAYFTPWCLDILKLPICFISSTEVFSLAVHKDGPHQSQNMKHFRLTGLSTCHREQICWLQPVSFHWRSSSTFREMCLFAFLLRVRWEAWDHSHACTLNIRLYRQQLVSLA